jgi:glycosyltransferase 2 family protein
MSKAIPFLLWTAALGMLALILSHLSLTAISQSLSALAPRQWLAWLSLNAAVILLAALRWRVLTGMLRLPVSLGELLRIRQAGQAVSFLTPGPQFGGEPLQIYWLCRRESLPLHSALLALGLDRCYELCVNFSVLILALVLLQTTPAAAELDWQKLALILGFILLTLTGLAWLILRQPQALANRIKRISEGWRQHPRLREFNSHQQRFSHDLKQLTAKQKPALLQALLISLCGWIALLSELWLLLDFCQLQLQLSAFLLIIVAMRLAFLLPLPGGIGPLEAALFWAFQFLSLPPTAAVSLIALTRLRDIVVLLLGLTCLWVLQKGK